MLKHWTDRSLPDLLEANGLAGIPEEPFPNDGWSGARLTSIRRDDDRFVLKRTSWATDWIARATRDRAIREAFVAGGQLPLPDGIRAPYLGVAADGNQAAILMPDLSGTLFDWERPIGATELDGVLGHLVRLHAASEPPPADFPWCPLRERLELLTPRAAERYRADGLVAGNRFLAGWAAFDRLAPPRARELVDRLSADAGPLLDAMGRLPGTLVHGDLKLANVGLAAGEMTLIDWQMVMRAPVAVELGWLLVSNVASLPVPPDEVLAAYRIHADAAGIDTGDWEAQVDSVWIVGLLLRGWRKGADAESGTRTGWGASGADDLAYWCERAVAAADHRL